MTLYFHDQNTMCNMNESALYSSWLQIKRAFYTISMFVKKITMQRENILHSLHACPKTLDTITWSIVENIQCKFETFAMEQFLKKIYILQLLFVASF
jgi:hypothetical protein